MRDRRDGTVDRIRAVRTPDHKYIRSFYPERAYTQFNGYQKHRYPVLTLMQVMKKTGQLTSEQAPLMTDRRLAEELYYLPDAPYEINNLADDSAHQDKLVALRQTLDAWLAKVDTASYPGGSATVAYA